MCWPYWPYLQYILAYIQYVHEQESKALTKKNTANKFDSCVHTYTSMRSEHMILLQMLL